MQAFLLQGPEPAFSAEPPDVIPEGTQRGWTAHVTPSVFTGLRPFYADGMFLMFPLRFMTTSAASCAPSTKMTAFLINLSVYGMGQTGKKLCLGWESFPWGAFGRFALNGVHPNGVQCGPQDLARIHYAGHELESVAKPVKRRMQWGPKFVSGLVQVTV